MEALSLGTESERTDALRAINQDVVQQRRKDNLQWWQMQRDDATRDTNFFDYLQSGSVASPNIGDDRALRGPSTSAAADAGVRVG